MGKQKKLIGASITLVLIIIGLSFYFITNFPPKFDDKVVTVSLVNQEMTSGGMNYTINVTNNGSYTLKNNALYFTARRYMQSLEAKATQGDKELIKPLLLLVGSLILGGCTKSEPQSKTTTAPNIPKAAPVTLTKEQFLNMVSEYADTAQRSLNTIRGVPDLLTKCL